MSALDILNIRIHLLIQLFLQPTNWRVTWRLLRLSDDKLRDKVKAFAADNVDVAPFLLIKLGFTTIVADAPKTTH